MVLICNCPELINLNIPNSRRVSVEEAAQNIDAEVHIPARLYNKFKHHKHVFVYTCEHDNYFDIEKHIPNATVREGIASNYEPIFQKSHVIRVEKPSFTMRGGDTSRFADVIHGSSKIIIIYFHGMNPHGMKFRKTVPDTLMRYCKSCEYSYGFYLRGRETDRLFEHVENNEFTNEEIDSFELTSNTDLDTYDLDGEYDLFKQAFESEFPNWKECQVYFLGHSYGACFSKWFAKQMNTTSISLDGSDLYTTVPYFIGCEPDEVEYAEKSFIYNGKNYYGDDEHKLWSQYCDVMWKCKDDYDKSIIINYDANEKEPNEVKLVKEENEYYKNYYVLHFEKEYCHTLHMHYECVHAIFKEFIEANYQVWRGVYDEIRDKHQDTINYVIRKPNGDDVTVVLYGENNHDEHPPQIIDWHKLDIDTLALFEDKNTCYDAEFNMQPDEWFPWKWNYWYQNKDKITELLDKYPELAKIVNDAKDPIPKNIRYIPCDYRNMALRNPLFRWIQISLDPNLWHGDDFKFPSSNNVTLQELKDSGYYNPKKPDTYYKKLIKKWSYDNIDEFINLRHKFLELNVIERFNLVMFEAYEIEDSLRPFLLDHCDENLYLDIFNDIPMLNEMEKEINGGMKKLIVVYGGSYHMHILTAYLSRYMSCSMSIDQDVIDDFIRGNDV